jgi:hypothetical protein
VAGLFSCSGRSVVILGKYRMDDVSISLAAFGNVELANGVCLVKGDYAGVRRGTHFFLKLPALGLEFIDVTSEVTRGLLKPTP